MTRSRDIADQQKNAGGAVAPFVGAKNKIINGDFSQWQRGTSFTLTTATDTYCADRFLFAAYGTGTAGTVTRQTFTPGSAPVTGYEGQYFARITNFATAVAWQFRQRIENVQTFAGQTVTVSFWVRASTSLPSDNIRLQYIQNFGSGGSGNYAPDVTSFAIGTSWERKTFTFNVASISGKTIGTGNYLEINFYQGAGAVNLGTVDTWGWQIEAGSVATPFTPAGGGFPGAELALCQRHYEQQQLLSIIGHAYNTTSFSYNLPYKVTKRTTPTITFLATGNYSLYCGTTSTRTVASVGSNLVDTQQLQFLASISGSTVTAGFASHFDCANSAGIVINAEL